MTVDLVLDARVELGEGPWWDERTQRLYWIDIAGCALHIYDPASGQDTAYDVGQMVGTVVLSETDDVWLAVQNGFARFDPATGQLDIVADPEADKPANRFNDGKCDPAGRFWAGTMDVSAVIPEKGSLYRLDPDLSLHTMLTGVSISNGIVWTEDRRTMYFIDTPLHTVTAFDYDDATGAIQNPRVAIQVPDRLGSPDGMTLDSEGMLWIAHFSGAAVRRWNPHTGELLDSIEIPATKPTACAFGGANLDELYITTARFELSENQLRQQPHAGSLFRVRPGVTGTLAHRFKG